MSRQNGIVDHEARAGRTFPNLVIALTVTDQATAGRAQDFLQLGRKALHATARSRTFAMISMGGFMSLPSRPWTIPGSLASSASSVAASVANPNPSGRLAPSATQ